MKELEKYGKVEIVKNDAFVHVENSKLYDAEHGNIVVKKIDLEKVKKCVKKML